MADLRRFRAPRIRGGLPHGCDVTPWHLIGYRLHTPLAAGCPKKNFAKGGFFDTKTEGGATNNEG